MVAWGDKG